MASSPPSTSPNPEGTTRIQPPAILKSTASSRAMGELIKNVKALTTTTQQQRPSEPSEPINLDLESYYRARLRRKSLLVKQISTDIPPTANGNNPSGGNGGGKTPHSNGEQFLSPSEMRGIRVTLSPEEEYENYKKVHSAAFRKLSAKFSGGKNNSLIEEDEEDLDEDDEEEDGKDTQQKDQQAKDNQNKNNPTGSTTMLTTKRKKTRGGSVHDAHCLGLGGRSRVSLQAIVHWLLHGNKMIHPHGRFRLGWDILSILFLFYTAIALPFQASFNPHAGEGSFQRFLDIFFGIDILVCFNTAPEKDGAVKFDRKLGTRFYLRSWFIIDVIAAIPYGDFFSKDLENGHDVALKQSLKLLRLIRLLRLFRISRIFQRIQNAVFIRSTLTALFRYVLVVMFVAHWFSCIFHAIGVASDPKKNWIKDQNLTDEDGADNTDRYVAALYFAVMTIATIGYGDVSGKNADERLFCIFAMICGGGIFAYGITNIVELVSSLTIQETRFREKMDEVNEYMKAREIPLKLRMEIREFYHNTRQSQESKLNSEQQILNDLSSKLRSKIALSINDHFLRKFPFFVGSDPNFLMELALNMRMIHFAPLEDVIVEGEIGHEMFFIFRGAVEVLRKGNQVRILGENQYFGELAILNADNRRTATVRTLCFCELRMLSRNRFLEALAMFPGMQSKMAKVAQKRTYSVTSGAEPQAPFNVDTGGQEINSSTPNTTMVVEQGRTSPPPPLTGTSVAGELDQKQDEVQVTTNARCISPSTPIVKRRPSAGVVVEPGLAPANPADSFEHVLPVLPRISMIRRGSGSNGFLPTTKLSMGSPSRLAGSSRLFQHRKSSVSGNSMPFAMALAVTEIGTLIEDLSHKQDILVTRMMKLQSDVDTLQRKSTSHSFSQPKIDEEKNSTEHDDSLSQHHRNY